MNIFTESGDIPAIDWKDEILKSIAYSGSTESSVKAMIAGRHHLANIVESSTGVMRINRSVVKKFNLILSLPSKLSSFNRIDIRCCLCNRIINYPCWYHVIKFKVNHLHFFVCFDSDSPMKPSVKCYRKE